MDCQKVLPFQKLSRGKILDNFKIGTLNVPEKVKASNNFVKSRLVSHQKQLFDVIPKAMSKNNSTMKTNADIHLETTKALRYIDFAIARDYDLSCAFKNELSEFLFFFVKDGILRKCDNKSELERALEFKLEHQPTKVMPSSDKKSMTVVALMVYAKKVRIKKVNVKTFGEFCQKVQNMILNLDKDYECTDIAFDICLENSVSYIKIVKSLNMFSFGCRVYENNRFYFDWFISRHVVMCFFDRETNFSCCFYSTFLA